MTTFWQLIQLLGTGQAWHIDRLCQVCLIPPASMRHLIKHAETQLPFPLIKTNQTYQLEKPIEFLSADKISRSLKQTDIQVEVLNDCTSTNQYLLQKIKTTEDIHAHAVLANWQTQGKGRKNHAWQTFIGGSLPLSLAWTFKQPQAQLGALPLVIAAAAWRVLQNLGIPAKVKWPNDIMIEYAKVGGILINSLPKTSGSIAIIGIGLNLKAPIINTQPTGGSWDYLPTCSINSLASLLLLEFNQALTRFDHEGFSAFTETYQNAHRDHLQEVVLWQNETILAQGRVLGVDDQGALLLDTDKGLQRFVNGQISLRSKGQV